MRQLSSVTPVPAGIILAMLAPHGMAVQNLLRWIEQCRITEQLQVFTCPAIQMRALQRRDDVDCSVCGFSAITGMQRAHL
jgi:hypothetical protein